MADPGETLTTREAAHLLSAHVETIRRLARRGKIPSFKIGKDWRFSREALLRWTETHHLRHREPHVLVVDDEEIIRNVIRRMLEAEGYRVAIASGGKEGLEYVSNAAPDLVLLDLKMPGMSGVECLRRFREEHADIPVMVVTGYPDTDLMNQAMRYGPLALLAKPVQKEELLRSVRMALVGSLGRERTT
ncbi:MAG: response regulator [Planctomycetes bacterium]|nr:response regulator [Planctomycetota bacterium]